MISNKNNTYHIVIFISSKIDFSKCLLAFKIREQIEFAFSIEEFYLCIYQSNPSLETEIER